MKKIELQPNFQLGILLAMGIIISTIIISIVAYSIKNSDNYIYTTGSAKINVVSDTGKISYQISRIISQSEISNGYILLAKDKQIVQQFLKDNNIKDNNINISAVNIYEIFNQNQEIEKKYTISQNIIVNLDDVNKIKDLGDKVSLIANKGVFISVNSLEYYYSKLKDVRVSLLSDAILDAKNRAEEIVKISGNRIGKLKSATNGVVQVLAKDSNEVSDYGSYDTSTIEKTIQVSVKANFLLN